MCKRRTFTFPHESYPRFEFCILCKDYDLSSNFDKVLFDECPNIDCGTIYEDTKLNKSVIKGKNMATCINCNLFDTDEIFKKEEDIMYQCNDCKKCFSLTTVRTSQILTINNVGNNGKNEYYHCNTALH